MRRRTWDEFALPIKSPGAEEDLFWNMKSPQSCNGTAEHSLEQVIQQRKKKIKYLWGSVFTSEEAAQLPRSVFFFLLNQCLQHNLKHSSLQIKPHNQHVSHLPAK